MAFGLHQNFDTRFVDVVATAPAVVHAHHGFEVVDDLVPRQELANHRADDGRAAHAAAHVNFEAHIAFVITQQAQANVVPLNGCAVFGRTGDGNFEFPRQVGELGVQGAPLAQHFGVGAWVDVFVHGNAGAFVAGDVANAVAAGLNAVQVDAGQQFHHVGAFVQRNPVELHVLTRGEVAVVGGELGSVNAANLVLCALCAFDQFS